MFNPRDKNYYPIFTVVEAEAQRGTVTCPASHSLEPERESEPRQSGFSIGQHSELSPLLEPRWDYCVCDQGGHRVTSTQKTVRVPCPSQDDLPGLEWGGVEPRWPSQDPGSEGQMRADVSGDSGDSSVSDPVWELLAPAGVGAADIDLQTGGFHLISVASFWLGKHC